MKARKRHLGKRKISRRRHQTSAPVEAVIFDSAYLGDKKCQSGRKMTGLASFAMLFMLGMILLGSFTSSFHVSPSWPVLLTGLFVICVFFTWFYLEKHLDGYRLLAGLLLVALYGAACFVLQEKIIEGYYRTAGLVVRVINQTYDGNLSVRGSGTVMDITVFLLAVMFGVTAVLAAGMVRRQKALPVLAVLFPVFSMMAIAGGRPSVWWLYLILIGSVVLLSASHSSLEGWKSAVFAGLLAVIVSIPSWYVVRPLLAVPAKALQKPAEKLEMRLMQSLYQVLPQISGGRLNLSLEGVGGGVEDGTLGAIDGYFFTGVETLRVTSQQKPMETVYLKGYIGQDYTGTSYEQGNEESFANAAASWHTEGNSSVYVHNLPFLRMMYYENYTGSDKGNEGDTQTENGDAGDAAAAADPGSGTGEPTSSGELVTTSNTISVENLNANVKYTYVPYYSFINDNYQIYGGDGYVGGQTIQEDIFPSYWRSSYQEAMEARRDEEEEGGVLDRVEASYRAYCNQYDQKVPEEGLERLIEECESVAREEKWNQSSTGSSSEPLWARADEIEEIRHYVLKRLLTSCEYELNADALPEGEDFIEYFLYETQEGYSMHFAAAATMMFRIFGVPARYVVGYVAPRELFSMDENGTYTAMLEDDNAHAWTEIYLPFLGWTPVEVTPGMETEMYGDIYMKETEMETEQTETEKEEADDQKKDILKNLFNSQVFTWLKNNLETVILAAWAILAAAMILYVLNRILCQRKRRLGLGKDSTGRICALYHSMYQMLVLAGMPPEYTITLTDSELISWLANCSPQFTSEDLSFLQSLILQANYGRTAPGEKDADWMYSMYRRTWSALHRRISLKKRLSYFWKG